MSFATQKANLAAQLVIFKNKILSLLEQPVNTAVIADNADRLNGLTTNQIKAPSEAIFNDHMNDINPHNVNAASLSTLTVAQTQALFASKTNQGEVPVSGITINGDIKIVNSKIVIPAGSTAFISGNGETLDADRLFNLPPLITGGTKYLYLILTGGTWGFAYFDVKIPESESYMYVTSHAFTNTTNYIVPNTNNIRIRRFDNYRLSTVNIGGSFIATKSDPGQAIANIWS